MTQFVSSMHMDLPIASKAPSYYKTSKCMLNNQSKCV